MSFPTVYVKNQDGARTWKGANTSGPTTMLVAGTAVLVADSFTDKMDGKVWLVLANLNPTKPATFALAEDFTPYDQVPTQTDQFQALIIWARMLGFKG